MKQILQKVAAAFVVMLAFNACEDSSYRELSLQERESLCERGDFKTCMVAGFKYFSDKKR